MGDASWIRSNGRRKTRREASPSICARASAERRRNAVTIRCRKRSNSARTSARCGTTNSPASLGVKARRSATRSEMLTSISCPTALITGIRQAKMALATTSSLKAHRSSRLPLAPLPGNHDLDAGNPCVRDSKLAAISCSCSHPLHAATGKMMISAAVQRRLMTCTMSRTAAPLELVIKAIRRGKRGNGRFRSAANNPSAASRS